MSLKRILGTMLATRMGGRGRRGGLGTAAMLGGFGRRRRGMGGKLGLAAMGYMAYRAYQDQKSSSGQGGGASSSSSGSGGIAGMVQDAVNKFTGGGQSQSAPDEAELKEDAKAADNLSDREALLLIRAMITAAYADGAMSTEERQRIIGEIDKAGADDEDRQVMEREIANPKPLDELLAEVDDDETAEEFYLASRAAVDGETDANQAYLAQLRDRLNLSDEQVEEVEEMAQ